jgi:hypothetical protein
MCGMVWCYTGPADNAEVIYGPIRRIAGGPLLDWVARSHSQRCRAMARNVRTEHCGRLPRRRCSGSSKGRPNFSASGTTAVDRTFDRPATPSSGTRSAAEPAACCNRLPDEAGSSAPIPTAQPEWSCKPTRRGNQSHSHCSDLCRHCRYLCRRPFAAGDTNLNTGPR